MNIEIIDNISKFMSRNKKYKHFKIVYHITSLKNAKKILKKNFDLTKTKNHAFGYGINFADEKDHLKIYHSKKKNTMVVSIIAFNKLKYNPPLFSMNSKEGQDFLKKYGYSSPTYFKIPKNFDGFFWKNIIVIENIKLICPLFFCDYK